MKNRLDSILNDQNGDDAFDKYLNRSKKGDKTEKDLTKILPDDGVGEQAIQKYLDKRKKLESTDSKPDTQPVPTPKIPKQEDKPVPVQKVTPKTEPVQKKETVDKKEEKPAEKTPDAPFSVEIPINVNDEPLKVSESPEVKKPSGTGKVKPIKPASSPKEEPVKEEEPPVVKRVPKEQPMVVSDGGSKINPMEIPPVQINLDGQVDSQPEPKKVETPKKENSPKKEQVKKPNKSSQTASTPSKENESKDKKNRNATVVVKNSDSKKDTISSNFDKMVKIFNIVTFNRDLKKLLVFGMTAMIILLGFTIFASIKSGSPIVNESASKEGVIDSLVDFTRSPQFESNDVGKDENILKMEKAVNEGKPANYYILLDSYQSLLADSKYNDFKGKENVVMIDKLVLELDPSSSKSHEVNQQKAPANAAITAWAIQTNSSALKKKVESNIEQINVAIETAFYNKDKSAFKDKKANESMVAFAVERVIGKSVKVERILVKGDF